MAARLPAVSKSTPASVRTWGESNGFARAERGRLAPALIEAFNKANPKAKYVQGKVPATSTRVTVKRAGQPPLSRNITVADVRASAAASGFALNTRGRLSKAAYQNAVLFPVGK